MRCDGSIPQALAGERARCELQDHAAGYCQIGGGAFALRRVKCQRCAQVRRSCSVRYERGAGPYGGRRICDACWEAEQRLTVGEDGEVYDSREEADHLGKLGPT